MNFEPPYQIDPSIIHNLYIQTNMEQTQNEIKNVIGNMNEASLKLSQAALDVAEQTKTLTDKILWLTRIMTIFTGASVIISIVSLIAVLNK